MKGHGGAPLRKGVRRVRLVSFEGCGCAIVPSYARLEGTIGLPELLFATFGAPGRFLRSHTMATSVPSQLENNARLNHAFEPLLDSTEAASLLRIHPKTLQRMARNGEIAGIQIGRLWRFRASELNSWLNRTRRK